MRSALVALCLVFSTSALAQTDAQLRLACKDTIEQQLHDPRNADLSGWVDGKSTKHKDGTYTVRFRGRARNEDGNLRLGTFECLIRWYPPDNYRVLKIGVR